MKEALKEVELNVLSMQVVGTARAKSQGMNVPGSFSRKSQRPLWLGKTKQGHSP